VIQDYPEAIADPAPGQRLIIQDDDNDRERWQLTYPDNATVQRREHLRPASEPTREITVWRSALADQVRRYRDVSIEPSVQKNLDVVRTLIYLQVNREVWEMRAGDSLIYRHRHTALSPTLNTKLPGPKASKAFCTTSSTLGARTVPPVGEIATYWPR
jgi:hypothetical protein